MRSPLHMCSLKPPSLPTSHWCPAEFLTIGLPSPRDKLLCALRPSIFLPIETKAKLLRYHQCRQRMGESTVHAQYGQCGPSYHQTSRMFRSTDELGAELFISRLLLCSQMTWTASVLSSELVFNGDESQDISVDKKRTFSKRYQYMQHRNAASTCNMQRKGAGLCVS